MTKSVHTGFVDVTEPLSVNDFPKVLRDCDASSVTSTAACWGLPVVVVPPPVPVPVPVVVVPVPVGVVEDGVDGVVEVVAVDV
ncbi:MAG: hypothetical protein M3217_06410, partial [Actinomycetota bacterium]|nr:hypothetical protein [Actinomycetota bacterium]